MVLKYVNKLEGKSVVIVGGTSGIGFCVAEACVEYGANVVVSSRSQEKIEKSIARLKSSYPDAAARIRGHVCDLSGDDIEASVARLFEFASDGGTNQIDHVANTAAESPVLGVTLEEATPERILSMQRTRFIGALMLAKAASGYLTPESTSSFTMTGGVSLYRPRKGGSIQAAAGGSMEVITRALAVDLAPVRVNLVSPGATETELMDAMARRMDGLEAARQVFRSMSILGQIGTVFHAEGGYLLK
ncbi:hypothetical protein LTR93_011306 [Exophiala xenobiotica]|nr:hypothetical protein LTR93_011306 [Exophiala xenobiotica]